MQERWASATQNVLDTLDVPRRSASLHDNMQSCINGRPLRWHPSRLSKHSIALRCTRFHEHFLCPRFIIPSRWFMQMKIFSFGEVRYKASDLSNNRVSLRPDSVPDFKNGFGAILFPVHGAPLFSWSPSPPSSSHSPPCESLLWVSYPELMLSGLVVACARSCVCFEYEFELNVKFTVNSWEDTPLVLGGSFMVVAQCLVADWCTNTCRVARLIVSHLISSHPSPSSPLLSSSPYVLKWFAPRGQYIFLEAMFQVLALFVFHDKLREPYLSFIDNLQCVAVCANEGLLVRRCRYFVHFLGYGCRLVSGAVVRARELGCTHFGFCKSWEPRGAAYSFAAQQVPVNFDEVWPLLSQTVRHNELANAEIGNPIMTFVRRNGQCL